MSTALQIQGGEGVINHYKFYNNRKDQITRKALKVTNDNVVGKIKNIEILDKKNLKKQSPESYFEFQKKSRISS